jgi:ABC-2 type transport system permease protein
VPAPPDLASVRDPARADALARGYVTTRGQTPPKLDAVAILMLADGAPTARLWTASAANPTARDELREALTAIGRDQRLVRSGIDPSKVTEAEAFQAKVDTLSPKSASGGKVGFKDQLPLWIGLFASFLLWSLTMTAAGILLNSVMEEKANRILEILVSSASTSEILAGKVLGVAAIAVTVLAVWSTTGLLALSRLAPSVTGPVLEALARDGLWAYLLLYFVSGYLMYAVLFAAIGAFCETPRDAQSLMGPIMLVMMIPLFVLQYAIRSPDVPALRILSWIPLFTPFVMAARGPTHLPPLEIAGTLLGMAITAALLIWVGGKAFRAGALSTGKLDFKAIVAAVRRSG